MCGANSKEREVQMSQHLPQLFEGQSHRSVLYVGANKKRQHFLDWFEKAGYSRIVVLEAFAENAEFLKAEISGRTPGLEVVHGDIRDKDVIPGDVFDVVFFWHGIEHILEDKIASVLERLEAISKVVVLGCPHGIYDQGPEYGNPYEEHLSAVYPQFLENLGYTTDVIGKTDERGSNILAWKFIRSDSAGESQRS